MKNTFSIVAFVIVLGLAFSGCKMSVDKACKKAISAMNDSRGDKKMDADKLKKQIEKCQERMKKDKKKKPKRIACEMKCIDSNSDWKGMKKCFKDDKCREKDK